MDELKEKSAGLHVCSGQNDGGLIHIVKAKEVMVKFYEEKKLKH